MTPCHNHHSRASGGQALDIGETSQTWTNLVRSCSTVIHGRVPLRRQERCCRRFKATRNITDASEQGTGDA